MAFELFPSNLLIILTEQDSQCRPKNRSGAVLNPVKSYKGGDFSSF